MINFQLTGDPLLVFGAGHTLPKQVADAVLRQLLSRRPELSQDRTYSSPQLCGQEFWSQFEDGLARRVGKYIAYLVHEQQLPLEFACCPHRSNKRYGLK